MVPSNALRNVACASEAVWGALSSGAPSGARSTAGAVGDVEASHAAQLRPLVDELVAAGEAELGVKLAPGAYDRLAAYGRSVAHFPTAVKEFEWRNGWFYQISKKAAEAGQPDPLPLHTAGLVKLGVVEA